jgi:hypothetical protein
MTIYVLCFFSLTHSGTVFRYVCYHEYKGEGEPKPVDGLYPMILHEEDAVSLSQAHNKLRLGCFRDHNPRLAWLAPFIDRLEQGEKIDCVIP